MIWILDDETWDVLVETTIAVWAFSATADTAVQPELSRVRIPKSFEPEGCLVPPGKGLCLNPANLIARELTSGFDSPLIHSHDGHQSLVDCLTVWHDWEVSGDVAISSGDQPQRYPGMMGSSRSIPFHYQPPPSIPRPVRFGIQPSRQSGNLFVTRACRRSANHRHQRFEHLQVACWNVRTMQTLKIVLNDTQHSWPGGTRLPQG